MLIEGLAQDTRNNGVQSRAKKRKGFRREGHRPVTRRAEGTRTGKEENRAAVVVGAAVDVVEEAEDCAALAEAVTARPMAVTLPLLRQ